jgi:hypothetical protein
MIGSADKLYEREIVPYLDAYMKEYFADVCTEFLKLMNLHNRLPDKFVWWDRWYGKNGTIDILAQTENKKTLVGSCHFEDRITGPEEYSTLHTLADEAKVGADYCYLFSRKGFSEELKKMAADRKNLNLIGLEDL